MLLKAFFINLLIFIGYISITMIIFVLQRYPNPIGVGIWQTIFILIHFAFILFSLLAEKSNPSQRKRVDMIIVCFSSLILFLVMYWKFEEDLWQYCWQLR